MLEGGGWPTDALLHMEGLFSYMEIGLSASRKALFAAATDPVHMKFVENQIQKSNFYI